MTTRIPMSSPHLTGAEVAAVREVVSTRYLSLGPNLEAFERSVADLGALPFVAYTDRERIRHCPRWENHGFAPG